MTEMRHDGGPWLADVEGLALALALADAEERLAAY
jgi:hypothetical protein